MGAQHTPGPWRLETVPTSVGTCHKIGPFPSRGVYDVTHACVYADSIHAHDIGRSKVGDELLANARLISAAPDMLAALEKARVAISTWSPAPDEPLREIDAAIAKARGQP